MVGIKINFLYTYFNFHATLADFTNFNYAENTGFVLENM